MKGSREKGVPVPDSTAIPRQDQQEPASSHPPATPDPKQVNPSNRPRPVVFSLLLDPVDVGEVTERVSSETSPSSHNSLTATSRISTTSKAVHTIFGNEQGLFDGGANSKMDRPMGLSLSTTGLTLYFCEFGSHTIRRATLGGPKVDTIAGTSGAGYQDGLPSSAQFSFPEDVCVVPVSPMRHQDQRNQGFAGALPYTLLWG